MAFTRTARIAALAFIVLPTSAVGFGGCSGGSGSGDDDDDGGTPEDVGGFVYLDYDARTPGLEGYIFKAEFYSSVTRVAGDELPMERVFSAVPLDECWLPPASGPDAAVTFLYVGEPLSVVTDGAQRNANAAEVDGRLRYFAGGFGTDIPPDSLWDVLIPGTAGVPAQSWTDALSLPAVPILTIATNETIDLSSGAAWEATWTAGAADQMLITFLDAFGETRNPYCRATDDGSFTIPAELIALLDSDGGSVHFRALDVSTQALLARDVLVVGGSWVSRPFSR